MTELQTKNFEHSIKELESANNTVAKLEAEHKDRENSVKFAQERLAQVDRDLNAANLKLLTARRRFDFAVSEIAPSVPRSHFAFGGPIYGSSRL